MALRGRHPGILTGDFGRPGDNVDVLFDQGPNVPIESRRKSRFGPPRLGIRIPGSGAGSPRLGEAAIDGDQRALIRRSPLPPAAVAELKTWLIENLETLKIAVQENRLFAEISPLALRFTTSRSIQAISHQGVVPRALEERVAGRSYAVIFDTLAEARVRVGRDHVTVEDAVALCESGFGYDVAMIAASIADLAEELDDALHAGTSLLQKQIKYGLTDRAAIAFHEAGFADRHVASPLGLVWGNVVDRGGVRTACQQEETIRAVLAHIPGYFVKVAAELGGWA